MICIIIAIIIIVLFVIVPKEGFAFNTLSKTPQPPKIYYNLPAPYCTNYLGQPVPCPEPCQKSCPTCRYSFPVPVFSAKLGAYSPSKFCPGPPLC